MTMAPIAGLRECPNKGKPNCLGVIEIGSHCFMCKNCRGNKPCSLSFPCRTCRAKILRNEADVKLGAAKAASQATSDPSSGGSPPAKRTRSKGSEPTIPDDNQASKPKKIVNYLSSASSSDSLMSVSTDEASPPVVTISDSTSLLSSSDPTTSAGDPTSGSSGVDSEDEGGAMVSMGTPIIQR